MKVQRYFSSSMQEALRLVREDLGPDAVILSNTQVDGGVEILVTLDYDDQAAEQSVVEFASNGGQPSASQVARLQAEKSMKLQREMEQAKKRIHALKDTKSDRKTATTNLNVAHSSEQPTKQGAALDSMQAQIRELKEMISGQANRPNLASAGNEWNLVQQQVDDMLSSISIAKHIRQKLVASLKEADDFDQAWAKVRHTMEGALSVDYGELIDMGGVVALVGPTGSGKTTTIGKLAARYVMKHGADSVALVTTDRYRIAAHEQLKVYGRILNIPVHVVDSENGLDDVLDQLSDRKLVLVDTAGLMHSDKCWTEQLQELKMSAHNVQSYLVMPAVGQYQVMCSNFNNYKMVGLAGAIITKVDEAVSLGEVLSFLIDTRLMAAYMTDGQKVPEDIHQVNKKVMLNKAEALLNSSERWVTISSHESQDLSEPVYFHSA